MSHDAQTDAGRAEEPAGTSPGELTELVARMLDRRHGFLQAAERFGTPQYLLHAEALRRQIARFCGAFARAGQVARVHYALKANPTLPLVKLIHDAGLAADASSGMELELALRVGFTRIVCSGPAKLPEELGDQTRSVIKACWRLEWKQGIARMEKHAQWLEREYPDAAGSLREGLEETFTINRMELPASLRRSLGSTNLIESNCSGIRRRTNRVCNWQSGDMAQRWCASALLETEKHFRRVQGYKDLWILKSWLDARQEVTNIEEVA